MVPSFLSCQSLMPNEKVVGMDENESVFVQTDHHNRGSA